MLALASREVASGILHPEQWEHFRIRLEKPFRTVSARVVAPAVPEASSQALGAEREPALAAEPQLLEPNFLALRY